MKLFDMELGWSPWCVSYADEVIFPGNNNKSLFQESFQAPAPADLLSHIIALNEAINTCGLRAFDVFCSTTIRLVNHAMTHFAKNCSDFMMSEAAKAGPLNAAVDYCSNFSSGTQVLCDIGNAEDSRGKCVTISHFNFTLGFPQARAMQCTAM